MSRYRFELATPADDPELRSILAHTPMPGAISLAFGREPSYFQAAVVEGRFRQALVVRDTATGELAGSGARSVSLRYVNGRPTAIGYLSSLRLVEPHRQRGLLARGYSFLHELHQDGRTELYLTTIADGNSAALQALTSRRAGLPAYHSMGQYHTLAIPLARSRMPAKRDSIEVRQATTDDLPKIIEFLHLVGAGRQFFPCYEARDFAQSDGQLRGLRLENLLLAIRRQVVVGTLAGWDQTSFRQDLIHSYGWPLNWVRPLYNAWAALAGGPRLPRAGESLRCLIGALPLVQDSNPAIFAALLGHVLRTHSAKWDYLLIGLHESDPLLRACQHLRARRYTTRVFAVCWEDGEPIRQALDGRPIYLELGSL